LAGHIIAVGNDPWGTMGEPRFSIDYLGVNLLPNIAHYFDNEKFPLLISILAILGLGWRGKWRERLLMASWFLLFWGVFIVFYAGSYRYGADNRYSLMSYAPLAVLAGFGAKSLGTLIQRRWPMFRSAIVISALLLLNFCSFVPFVRRLGEESWDSRVDHDFSRVIAAKLPENSIIFTHNTSLFLLHNQSTAQLYMLSDKTRLAQYLERFKGGVYLHLNYWCTVMDENAVQFCHNVLSQYELEEVATKDVWRVKYGLYRVIRAKD
jgi:hypothetical protein